MKLIYKTVILALLVCTSAGLFYSCSEDLVDGGAPSVSYVRITNPTSSDSLLVAAGQGQMIAIIGQNFQGIRQLWFNDQQASLNPIYITSTSIITRVPSKIPSEINNLMKMVFENGQTLEYDFSVDISEPTISYIKSEFVNTGDIATIYGDYFYEPIKVTFTGGIEGIISSREDQKLEIEIPDGVQPGPITITTNFGEIESDFWFRDNRNIIASFDVPIDPIPSPGGEHLWHGEELFTSTDTDINSINGNFIRLNKQFSAWDWFELYVGTPSDNISTKELKNIPQEAFENPEKFALKFEINTLAPLTGANIRMYIGPDMNGQRGDIYYNWQPNVDTGGEWETLTLSWKDIYVANHEFAYNVNGYGISIHFSGPNAFNGNFAIDNMRVVPYKQ
jgi:hypothetical protein